MKITKVEVTGLTYPLKEPFFSSVRRTVSRSCILLQMHTDTGIIGLGESDYAGGPISSTIQVLKDELIPMVIGKDPFHAEAIWDELYHARIQHGGRGILMHAMSGLDIAMWDIVARHANLPLYRMLGGYADRVPIYASGGLYRDEKDSAGMTGLPEEVQYSLSRGFTRYKMKIGRLDIGADQRRVRAVREQLGPDRELMVDCNGAWDLPTAFKWIPFLEEMDVKFIEEPFPVDNLDDSACLAARTRIPIAGYENESSLFGFREIIEKNAAYYLQPNAIRVGGVTPMRKIAALAYAHHRFICPHSFSSMVGLICNMHILATLSNGLYLEHDINENALRENLCNEPLLIENGCVSLPEAAGLGITLNIDAVNRYRIH